MLQTWYKGRGKILEPSASKNDKSANNVLLLLLLFKRLYLNFNKSTKWSLFLDPVTYRSAKWPVFAFDYLRHKVCTFAVSNLSCGGILLNIICYILQKIKIFSFLIKRNIFWAA